MTDFRTQSRRQVFRYLQVGFAGFVTDVAVLSALIYGMSLGETETGLVGSRFVSFLAAVTVTFILNARYTFGASIRDSRFPIYVLVQSLGAAITLGSYTALVLYTSLAQAPVVALIIGSAAATTSNFLLVRRFVYV